MNLSIEYFKLQYGVLYPQYIQIKLYLFGLAESMATNFFYIQNSGFISDQVVFIKILTIRSQWERVHNWTRATFNQICPYPSGDK